MRTKMRDLVGIKGTGLVTARGWTKRIDIDLPPDADPELQKIFDEMKKVLDNLCELLPEEPLGEGAKWRVNMSITTSQFYFDQEATYTLRERIGDTVKLSITVRQSAPRQRMKVNDPKAGSVTLESLTGHGSATGSYPLNSFVPTVQATINVETEISSDKMKDNIRVEVNTTIQTHPQGDGDEPEMMMEAMEPERRIRLPPAGGAATEAAKE